MRRIWRGFGRTALVVVLALATVVASGSPAVAGVAPDPEAASRAAASPAASPAAASPPVAASMAGGPPAAAPMVAASESGHRWVWPLRPQPQVVHRFEPPDLKWGAGHRGVDLAATVGQDVLAPADGVVTFSGVVVDRGVVVVAMPSGLRVTFEPVEAGPPVGAAVAAGEPVGHVAATPGHCAPATCLHWGVLRDDTYLDPLALVGSTRVILLPLLPRAPP